MDHLTVPQLLGLLAIMLAGAKLFGALAKQIGQPAVLGELVAGVVLGGSAAGLVDPRVEVLHLLSELGVVILLFAIGLETDLRKLVRVGGESTTVAVAGVVLPFALGYGTCRLLGYSDLVSLVAGATLTATSVGITGRVLADLNRLGEPESQIILGAAVIDDIVGLIILAVVQGLTEGHGVTAGEIARTTFFAFGFLVATLLVGWFLVPLLIRTFSRVDLPGTPTMLAVILAFGLAWLASVSGSAMIIGAFAAGVLARESPQAHEIERGVASLGHFFVPLFFVTVGSAVDLQVLNPFVTANQPTVIMGALLVVVAVIGKFAAGHAAFWFRGNKNVIGVGMIPRGEVGLIFAQMGLSSGVFDAGLFSAVTLMVMVTTFLAPPLLKWLFPSVVGDAHPFPEAIEELVTEP